MNHLEHLINEKKVFFNYMNENFTIFQYSNLFFRDLQYAILSYFEMKEQPIKYAAAEKIAKDFIENLVKNNELTQIDHKSWKINFEVGTNQKQVEMEEVDNG
jgi:TolB-like protein